MRLPCVRRLHTSAVLLCRACQDFLDLPEATDCQVDQACQVRRVLSASLARME